MNIDDIMRLLVDAKGPKDETPSEAETRTRRFNEARRVLFAMHGVYVAAKSYQNTHFGALAGAMSSQRAETAMRDALFLATDHAEREMYYPRRDGAAPGSVEAS